MAGADAFHTSVAISLKRIANALESIDSTIEQITKFRFNI